MYECRFNFTASSGKKYRMNDEISSYEYSKLSAVSQSHFRKKRRSDSSDYTNNESSYNPVYTPPIDFGSDSGSSYTPDSGSSGVDFGGGDFGGGGAGGDW